MPGHDDLKLLTGAALEAGEIAMGYARDGAQAWDKPEDAGPVTEADLAVNRLLQDRLCTARPDYGWLSEETEDNPARLHCDRVFIIDPIDGTRSFVEGSHTWAHSLAVAEHGIVTAAVVYLPLRKLLYCAASGQGATLNGAPLKVADRAEVRGAAVLATRPVLEAKHWKGPVPEFVRSHRPSLAYRLSIVAQGRFDAMLTLRPAWEWDIAAGDLILREAGAVISDRKADALRYNNAHPQLNGVIAANPALHGALIQALS